jgi:hypothetical protein
VLILTLLITLGYCAWVLSLPLFPTQDGPMHLYFVNVLKALLGSGDPFYKQFYLLKSLLPPYALYYYLLLWLSSFLPLLLADKLIICLYFFSFVLGFRYLAQALGPNGDITALLSTMLLLNWALFMGFVNFSLSTALALWALGLWARALDRESRGLSDHPRRIAFVVLAYVMMLTHPVPLLVALTFGFIELGLRLLRFRLTPASVRPSRFTPSGWITDLLYLLGAASTILYVRLFTTSDVLNQIHRVEASYLKTVYWQARDGFFLHFLTPFSGKTPLDFVIRGLYWLLLASALYVCIRLLIGLRRGTGWTGTWTLAHTFAVVALILLFSYSFIPSDLNNSGYFGQRLLVYVWIGAMLAASAWRTPWAGFRPIAIALAMAGTVLLLFLAITRIDRPAREIATIEQIAPIPRHSVGLLLRDPAYFTPSSINTDPYFWSIVRIFRRTDSVLYNTPWLDLAIIPVGAKPVMPTSWIDSNALEAPILLRKELEHSTEERNRILAEAKVVIISFGAESSTGKIDRILQMDELTAPVKPDGSRRTWACVPQGTLSICTQH